MNWQKGVGVIAFSLVVLAGVFYSGYSIGYEQTLSERATAAGEEDTLDAGDFAAFWKAWNTIDQKYLYTDRVNTNEKIWGSIKGLTASLDDPYTRFFPPEPSKKFQQNISGEFGGVGMRVGMKDGMISVVSPLSDSPAERAGVEAGDTIVGINGTSTQNMSVETAVSKIRGEIGTTVTLSLTREGRAEPFEIEVERSSIDIPTVETERVSGEIFRINAYHFTANSVAQFKEALREFQDSGRDKLILDLRGNPGGFLQASVEAASYFLPSGEVVVKERRGEGDPKYYRSKGYNVFGDDLEMVVLVNEGSASASEILAAALSEHNVATLVGERTFGKGTVQELVQITSETSLKLTVAEWLTPNGNSFSEEGLKPDVTVEASAKDFEEGNDPQLQKAIEILEGRS